MGGIFAPGLGAAGTAIGQTAPMPLPLPVPGSAAGPMGGSGANTGIDGNVGGLSRTRSRERPCKCPPEKGNMGPVNHSMSDLSAEYQEYITKFPRGMEWIFGGRDFDGFLKARCLLQETKANYDFFFDGKTGKPKFFFLHGKGPNTEGPAKNLSAWDGILEQAQGQNQIVLDNPPTDLTWYFMQRAFYAYATKEFASKKFQILTQYKPMPDKEG